MPTNYIVNLNVSQLILDEQNQSSQRPIYTYSADSVAINRQAPTLVTQKYTQFLNPKRLVEYSTNYDNCCCSCSCVQQEKQVVQQQPIPIILQTQPSVQPVQQSQSNQEMIQLIEKYHEKELNSLKQTINQPVVDTNQKQLQELTHLLQEQQQLNQRLQQKLDMKKSKYKGKINDFESLVSNLKEELSKKPKEIIKTVEKRVEIPKQIIKEVEKPVEKIVTIEKPVFYTVDRFIETQVEKPVFHKEIQTVPIITKEIQQAPVFLQPNYNTRLISQPIRSISPVVTQIQPRIQTVSSPVVQYVSYSPQIQPLQSQFYQTVGPSTNLQLNQFTNGSSKLYSDKKEKNEEFLQRMTKELENIPSPK